VAAPPAAGKVTSLGWVKLSEAEARRRFESARVARLGTVDAEGRPHLVPVTFAVEADVVVVAVDHKPKSSTDLRRLRNIQVSLLVDEYDDRDWTRLWWVRADGAARVLREGPQSLAAVGWLRAKYPQYATRPQRLAPSPPGAVIWAEVVTWRGWAAAPADTGNLGRG
jgi:PPOX class probable F420-dependent enzyme